MSRFLGSLRTTVADYVGADPSLEVSSTLVGFAVAAAHHGGGESEAAAGVRQTQSRAGVSAHGRRRSVSEPADAAVDPHKSLHVLRAALRSIRCVQSVAALRWIVDDTCTTVALENANVFEVAWRHMET